MHTGGTTSGRGVAAASPIENQRPSKVGCSSPHISRQICTTSSNWRRRVASLGNSYPYDSYSSLRQPAPIPRMKRFPDSTCKVDAIFAVSAGLR
jgi:hypothetical protein